MMELTKEEQIQAIYDLKVGYTLGHADIAILKAMARQLLAGMEQEPVAQVYQPANIGICAPLGPSVMMLKPLSPGTKLYAAPQLPQPALVPQELNTRTANDVMNEHLSWKDYGDAEVFCIAWNACRSAMLQGAEPVRARDDLPEVVLHMGQAMSVFEALKKELLFEHVRHAELGAMGAVNVQVWTSILGGALQFEATNGGCTLRVTQAAPQQEEG